MKFSQKFTATYVQGKHSYPAYDFLINNPPIKQLRMINYSASGDIQHLEAKNEAVSIIHYFETLQISHEPAYDQEVAINDLASLLMSGQEPAVALSSVVDRHYLFDDER